MSQSKFLSDDNMAEEKYAGYALIYGGLGALGSGCVSQFKVENWWVLSVEVWKPSVEPEDESAVLIVRDNKEVIGQSINNEADVNVLVNTSKSLQKQEEDLITTIDMLLNTKSLDAIVCVAGGYVPGNTAKDFIENCERMWVQNMWPSLLATKLAYRYLKEGGMLCLTGAKAALTATPQAIGYGYSKAAIHQLTKSLGNPSSGLPKESFTVCLLPVTLDTVMNRQLMPTADISGWTPTKYITEYIVKWARGNERPENGSLVQFVTKNFNTDVSIF